MNADEVRGLVESFPVSAAETARTLGVTRQRLAEYMNGKRRVTGTVAAHLRTLDAYWAREKA